MLSATAMRGLVISLVTAAYPLRAAAQQAACGPSALREPSHTTTPLAAVEWLGSGGLTSAVLEGDPAKAGAYTLLLKLADGFWIKPHWHPEAKRVVVLTGTLRMGSGAAFDTSAATVLPQGGFSLVPQRHVHFEGAKGETILLLTGCGPLATTFVEATGR